MTSTRQQFTSFSSSSRLLAERNWSQTNLRPKRTHWSIFSTRDPMWPLIGQDRCHAVKPLLSGFWKWGSDCLHALKTDSLLLISLITATRSDRTGMRSFLWVGLVLRMTWHNDVCKRLNHTCVSMRLFRQGHSRNNQLNTGKARKWM